MQNVTADEIYIIERALYDLEEKTYKSIDFWEENQEKKIKIKGDEEYLKRLKERAKTINAIIKSIDITTAQ